MEGMVACPPLLFFLGKDTIGIYHQLILVDLKLKTMCDFSSANVGYIIRPSAYLLLHIFVLPCLSCDG